MPIYHQPRYFDITTSPGINLSIFFPKDSIHTQLFSVNNNVQCNRARFETIMDAVGMNVNDLST